MAKNDTGVYQLPNKNWGYRYVLMVNGERKEARKTKDEFGAPFKTKREAIKARQAAIEAEQTSRRPKPTVRKTVAEIYQEYCEKGERQSLQYHSQARKPVGQSPVRRFW